MTISDKNFKRRGLQYAGVLKMFVLPGIIAMVALVCSAGARAYTFVDSGQSLGTGNTWATFALDVDGDGDLDFISANNAAANNMWVNNGDGVFSFSGFSFGNNDTSSIVVVDVDGDCDLDVIEGNGVKKITSDIVFLGNGSGSFSDSGQLLGNAKTHSIAAGDFDADGDYDLLIGSYLSSPEVFTNDGNGIYTDTLQVFASSKTEDIALADLDSDGDLDIIAGNYQQANTVLMNDGFGTFTDSGQLIGNNKTQSLSAVDIDGDGDIDFIAGDAKNQNNVYSNNGSGVFTDTGQSLGAGDTTGIFSADFDGDGDIDTALGNAYAANVVWLNNGTGNFSDSGQSLGTNNTYSLTGADVDGDGDIDLIEGNGLQGNRIWMNTSNHSNANPTAVTLTSIPSVELSGATASITFDWTAGTDAETAVSLLTYDLRVGTSSSGCEVNCGSFNGIGTTPWVTSVKGNNEQLTSKSIILSAGTYYWSARTVDTTYKYSTWAAEQSFTLLAANPPAFSGAGSILGCGPGCMIVGWKTAVDAEGSNPVTYNIYQATLSAGQDFLTPTYTTAATSYRITGLSNGTTYYYVVRAVDSVGNEDTNVIEVSRAAGGTSGSNFSSPVAPYPTNGAGGGGLIKWQAGGTTAGDNFGNVVENIGDVNNDGINDILVGADKADQAGITDAGSAYVYSGANGTLIYQYDGMATEDYFGKAGGPAGDVNNDGYADFAVGAPNADPGGNIDAGMAFVFSGADGSLLYYMEGGAAGDRYGRDVGFVSDVNGDGYDEFIVSAFYASPGGLTRSGSAYVYSGADGSLLYQKDGEYEQARFGVSVSSAGDVNNDSRGDFIIGSYYANPGGVSRAGSAYVYSGADGSLLYRKDGANAGDMMGLSVAGTGDINGDGRDDFIASAYKTNPDGVIRDGGTIYVYSGADGSQLFSNNGEGDYDVLGWNVSYAGDVNNDGTLDYMAYAHWGEDTEKDAGSFYIYSGVDGSIVYQKIGAVSLDQTGYAVTGLDDIDGDGYGDIAAGAPGITPGGLADAGAVLIYSNDTAPPTVTDSQAGDDILREANTATYNVDFFDTGSSLLDKFQVSACTTATICSDIIDWTDVVTGISAANYTTNWALPTAVWDALPSGVSYISVKAYDGSGSSTESGPVFYVRKKSTGPEFASVWTDGVENQTYSVEWGDYDGDGDMDQLIGDNLSPVKVLARTSASSFSVVWTSSLSESTFDASWGDYDGDGDLDVVVGNYAAANRVYQNSGGSFALVWTSENAALTSKAVWGDYDNDGDLDVMFTSIDTRNRIWAYDGSNTFSALWRTALEDDVTYAIDNADFDKDGDLDIVVGNGGLPNRVYLNDGDGTKFTTAWNSSEADDTFGIVVGDFNADGNPDFAAGNYQQANRIYTGNGAGSFTLAGSTTETDLTKSLAAGDVDADGDIDIVVGNYIPEANRIYTNDGSANFSLSWSSAETEKTLSIVLGDYDSDGDLDQLVANSGAQNRVYQNVFYPGNTGPTTPTITAEPDAYIVQNSAIVQLQWSAASDDSTPSSLIGYQVRVGTSPGANDVVSGTTVNYPGNAGNMTSYTLDLETGTYYWSVSAIDNTGYIQGSWSSQDSFRVIAPFQLTWTSPTTDKTYDVEWGDYNGDGYLDIVAANNYEPIKVYTNASGGSLSLAWSSSAAEDARSVSWGDYDNDGDLDIVVANYNTMNAVYRNDGGASFVNSWNTTNNVRTEDAQWADYNSDGSLDLIFGNYNSVNRVWKSQGDGTFLPIWASAEGDNTTDITNMDMTGDGIPDIIVGNRLEPNRIYQYDSNDGYNLIWSSSESDDTFRFAAGDFDNDGDLDAFAANITAANRVYSNNGSGSLSVVWATTETDDTRDAEWGDYDGDGDLDIMCGNFLQTNKLYRKDAGTSFSMQWQSEDMSRSLGEAWGDFDNDGDIDSYSANVNANDYIYRNLINPVNSAPSAPSASAVTDAEIGSSPITVSLNWTAPADDNTPANLLTYQVRIGTCSGCADVMSNAFVPPYGNSGHGNSMQVQISATGTFYWAVQAIDNTGYSRSAWSGQDSFNVAYNAALGRIGITSSSRRLDSGWQLVTVPDLPLDGFSDILDEFVSNFAGDSTSFSLDSEKLIEGINAFIEPGRGYWVHVPENFEITLPVISMPSSSDGMWVDLDEGWNIIGNPFLDNLIWSDNIEVNCGSGAMTLSDAVAASYLDGKVYSYEDETYKVMEKGGGDLIPWTGYLVNMSQGGCSINLKN